MKQNYQPLEMNERIHEIDGIRGFALLGILMMNIMSFASTTMQDGLEGNVTEVFTGSAANELTIMFINTFVTTNFYTMFSFLFGLSFYIFLSRAAKKVQSTHLLFLRRMGMLLIFGIIHGVFLWYGDILWTYAVAGLFLLIFYRFSPKVNLIIAAVILGFGTLFVLLSSVISIGAGEMSAINLWFDMEDTVLNGSYADIVVMNLGIMALMVAQAFVTVPNVLALFLIGLYAGQKGIFSNLNAHKKLINRVAVIGLGAGLPIKLLTGYAQTYGGGDMFWSNISLLASTLGGPLMALGYIALFIIISRYTKSFVKLLQPVGQMALTNYIAQTVIMLIIFYGFGLFNQVEAAWFIPITVAVFGVQVFISTIWMKIFKYGPLEYIWRIVTYMNIISIKR